MYTKAHQFAPFKKTIGGHAPKPSIAMRLAKPCVSHCFATCKLPNLTEINLSPPPPIAKSWLRNFL